MKLVLASQGFTTSEIVNATARLVGKSPNEINIAIINEAYVANEVAFDQKWLIDELSLISKNFGGTIAFVNLLAYDLNDIKKRLEFADIIYIVGGKQKILPRVFHETGFDKLLVELAEDKVVFGTSAGANVLGKQIEPREYWQQQYGSVDDYFANPTLGLVDFNILPHFGRVDRPNRTAQFVEPLLRRNPFPLYGITDEQAVFYDEGKVYFIGGEPVIFGKSK
jgi:Peptidase E